MGPYSITIITAIIIAIIIINFFERNSREVGKFRVFLRTRVAHISQVPQSFNGSFVQI